MSNPFDDSHEPKPDPYQPYDPPYSDSYGESKIGPFSRSELAWASGMHLSGLVAALLGGGIFGFVGPLIMWLIKRHDSAFLDDQGREALNFHLSMILWWVVAWALILVSCGLLFPAAFVPLALQVVFSVIAAIKSNDGIEYRYPLTIRFV